MAKKWHKIGTVAPMTRELKNVILVSSQIGIGYAGTKIPVGNLANHKLRTLRRTAHQYFDQLHQSGMMSKQDAYLWLAGVIQAPLSEAHIGHLSEYYCKQVIEESRKLLDSQRARIEQRSFRPVQGGAIAS